MVYRSRLDESEVVGRLPRKRLRTMGTSRLARPSGRRREDDYFVIGIRLMGAG